MPILHQTHSATRSALLFLSIAALIMLIALQFPRFTLFTHRHEDHVSLHLLLEMVSILVSAMVVSVVWISKETHARWQPHILIYGFTLVAGFDVLHAITFNGMPSFINPANSDESIFFWLAGRIATIGTIIAITFGFHVPGKKITWFVLAITTLLFSLYIGTYHLDDLPAFFIPGEGVTPIKQVIEYIIFTISLLTAAWLFYRGNKQENPKDIWLAATCGMMGLSELAFTTYINSSEFLNVFGHLYKASAYALLYRVIVFNSIQAPYTKLEAINKKIKQQEQVFRNLINNLPIDIIQIDAEQRIQFISKRFTENFCLKNEQPFNKNWQACTPESWHHDLGLKFMAPQNGQRVSFDLIYSTQNQNPIFFSVIAIPNGEIKSNQHGVLAIFIDITDQEITKNKLNDAEKENTELKAALDAHAIVAVTNARGVITNVNEKFCQISKYSREELIGKTHSIINSGHHPKSFFSNLWKTISSGQVWNGEICNRAKDGSLYWVFTTIVPFVDKLGKPLQYIAIRADITEQKRAEQNAQHMALYDVLTGLPNRRLMIDRLNLSLAMAARLNEFGALLLLDLDHFKEVNDTQGHDQGDELLRQVATRLSDCVRQSDSVARMGGDEFVIILNSLSADRTGSLSMADEISEKIRARLTEPYILKNTTVFTSPSIGSVLFHDESDSGEELLKRADMALYRAKAQGRNRIQHFDPSLQTEITEHAQMLAELREAEKRNELVLFYQPIVDLDQKVTGYEALIRWRHSIKGLIPPAKFIPIAEKSGLILPIGEWVVQQACQQLARWAQTEDKNQLSIAVNVSAMQFRDANFTKK